MSMSKQEPPSASCNFKVSRTRKTEDVPVPPRVDGRYSLREALATNSYATMYRAEDLCRDRRSVAVMLERIRKKVVGRKRTRLEDEYKVLQDLQGGAGIPRAHTLVGEDGHWYAMVIDHLGPSLDQLRAAFPSTFDRHRVATLGLQLISRLEHIHFHSYVHHRIEPQNLRMGPTGSDDDVFFVHFAYAAHYRYPPTRSHFPINRIDGGPASTIGTRMFASVHDHRGYALSRKDDLESLAYTLLFLYRGTLPWRVRWTLSAIHDAKVAFAVEPHPEVPAEVMTLLQYTRRLEFDGKPDYEYLRGVFADAISESGGDTVQPPSCDDHDDVQKSAPA